MPICVVGMHRSGTSVTARVLSQLGVDLGPEETLLEADAEDNPRGYWEQRGILALNDELLERLGGPWTDPPRLREGWHLSSRLDDLRRRADALLESTFGDGPWGWKDPRCSLTLPFWRSVAPAMRVVVCVRHPLEVAESWARRGPGFDAGYALELWIEHTARALIDSEGLPRLVIHHQDFFRDLDGQIARLARFASGEDASVAPETAQAIRDFVSDDLWRSRRGNGAGTSRLPAEVEALYDVLVSAPPDSLSERDALAEHARRLLASRHRAQNRDLRGYVWFRLRERGRRRLLRPFLWRVRRALLAAHERAASMGRHGLARRLRAALAKVDRLRARWLVE